MLELSRDNIRSVRERIDIVDIIGEHVSLKKQGRNYVGLCPFHQEDTPSFSVSPSKALYYCFGCQAGGDVFSFLMRYRGVDFPTIARELGQRVGVEIAPEAPERRARREAEERLVQTNRQAQELFARLLWAQQGQETRAYLERRGVLPALARRFGLGFGGTGGELVAYLQRQGIAREAAEAAGLLRAGSDHAFVTGRLTFPIYNALGRLAGFGARALRQGGGSAGGPKYLNSCENLAFSKRRLLYGWLQAQDAIRSSKEVVLVEGYMDVLACHRAGTQNAVAALGTAFSSEHAAQCAGLACKAVLLLDGDAAGQRAARKVTEQLLGAGLAVRIGVLPAGEDPASVLLGQGPSGVRKLVAEARPSVDYLLDRAFPSSAMSIEEKASAARDLSKLISSFRSGLERDLYLAKLAQRVGVPPEQLKSHLAASGPSKAAPPPRRTGSSQPAAGARDGKDRRSQVAQKECEMLRELLLYPELRPRLGELAEFAQSEQMRILLGALGSSDESAEQIVVRCCQDDTWKGRLAGLEPLHQVAGDEAQKLAQRARRTYDDVLGLLKMQHVDAALRDVIRELKEREAMGVDTDDLLLRKRELTRTKRVLRGARSPA